jgi:hypothetical protein
MHGTENMKKVSVSLWKSTDNNLSTLLANILHNSITCGPNGPFLYHIFLIMCHFAISISNFQNIIFTDYNLNSCLCNDTSLTSRDYRQFHYCSI